MYGKRLYEAHCINDEMQAVFEGQLPVTLFVSRGILEQVGNHFLCKDGRKWLDERVPPVTVKARITIDCFHCRHALRALLLICDHRVPPWRRARCRTVPLTLLPEADASQKWALTCHLASTHAVDVPFDSRDPYTV